jgi:hypothetical protein
VTRPAAKEAIAVVAGFTAFAIVWTWPLARYATGAVPSDLGDPLSLAFKLAWVADRLAHGLRDFWNAPIFFPYPNTFAWSEHVFGMGIFTAPVYWLSGGNPLLTYNVAFVASYVLAACGMYLLARRLTGRVDAAIIAAVAFAFGPQRAGRLSHLQVLMSGWMPIGLWALHRYFSPEPGATGDPNRLRQGYGGPPKLDAKAEGWPYDVAPRRRYVALGIFVIAFLLQGLSNGYFLYFFSIAVTIVLLFELSWAGPARWRRLVELAAAGVVILAALLPFALAYLRLDEGPGLTRSDREIVGYSARVSSYFQVSDRTLLWRGVLRRGRPENELFPGAMTLMLAALAIASAAGRRSSLPDFWRTRRMVRLYVTVAAAAFVLSLGPRPSLFGVPLGISGPYGWLMASVPGMSGLRVPSRIAPVVFVALAALASIGAAWLLARIPGRWRTVATAAIVAATAAEGYMGAMTMKAFSPMGTPNDRETYHWIAQSSSGGLLELPIYARVAAPPTFQYQFAALSHRHPVVNGFSGHESAVQNFLSDAASPLSDPAAAGDALRGLRLLGVRYIVLHRLLFPDSTRALRIVTALDEHRDQTSARRHFGANVVWELAPSKEPPVRFAQQFPEIPRGSFEARASVNAERLPMAFDGNIGTRWLSAGRQTGSEWIELSFDRPRDVARVRLDVTGRSFGDYPRELIVEATSPSGEIRQLYRDRILPVFLQGLVADPFRGPVVVDLGPNQSKALRLRQVGETRSWFWSIHELTVYERPD